jgi:hypothetical protein
MVKNNININTLTQAYIDSLYWYRQLLDTIAEEEPEEELDLQEIESE